MGARNYRFAEESNATEGETVKGSGATNLIYQTAQNTAVPGVGGASVGSVKGPQETSMCIVAYANSAVNSTGANGTTYDVTFYGGSTSGTSAQLAAMNGAVKQCEDDGIDISELTNYPYTSDPAASGLEINQANEIPIIVIINNTVVS